MNFAQRKLNKQFRIVDPDETKILHALGPTIAARRLVSNEFGLAVYLLLQASNSPWPSRSNMRTERDYRNLASVLLQLATAPTEMADCAEGLSNSSDGEGHRDVVGTIVYCNHMFFLTEESSPHAYRLTNIWGVRKFLGRKVRVTGTLQSPHALAVQTVNELH